MKTVLQLADYVFWMLTGAGLTLLYWMSTHSCVKAFGVLTCTEHPFNLFQSLGL